MMQRIGETYDEFRERVNAYDRKRYADRKFQVNKVSRDGDGTILATQEGPEREPYEAIPGFNLARRSSLVDAEGNVIQAWHIERPEDAARWAALNEAAAALRDAIVRHPYIEPPCLVVDGLTAYPIGDHHLGMLAWKHEVGESWDIDIAEAMLGRAVDHLVNGAAPTSHALIAVLGDFLHYDSMVAVTPQHGNILDADGRAQKMVRAGHRTMRYAIERVAEKHEHVHVILEFGNHDPFATVWMMELLAEKYADNPRITIDTSPGAFHFYRFGKNLIATHHGDKVKPQDLPGIMAADRAQDWGETLHRTWYIGHRHQRQAWDFPGCTVEMMRVLPGPDAYAHMLGYRQHRQMQAITYHSTQGEIGRQQVTPEMLK